MRIAKEITEISTISCGLINPKSENYWMMLRMHSFPWLGSKARDPLLCDLKNMQNGLN